MPSFSLSKKYCRISGRISSSRKRICGRDRVVRKTAGSFGLRSRMPSNVSKPKTGSQQHQLPILRVMVENPDAKQQARDDAADRQYDVAR